MASQKSKKLAKLTNLWILIGKYKDKIDPKLNSGKDELVTEEFRLIGCWKKFFLTGK